MTSDEIAAKYDQDVTPDDVVGLSNEEIYRQDPNILAASWLHDLPDIGEKNDTIIFRDRTVFFNSESILNK